MGSHYTEALVAQVMGMPHFEEFIPHTLEAPGYDEPTTPDEQLLVLVLTCCVVCLGMQGKNSRVLMDTFC